MNNWGILSSGLLSQSSDFMNGDYRELKNVYADEYSKKYYMTFHAI